MWQLGCKQPRERNSAFPAALSTTLFPYITNKADHAEARAHLWFFQASSSVWRSAFNHLALSFTLAFYHVIMWKHILQSWSLSETTGATESLQLLRIHWRCSEFSCSSSEHWCAFCGFGQLDIVCLMLLFTTKLIFYVIMCKYSQTGFFNSHCEIYCKRAPGFQRKILLI